MKQEMHEICRKAIEKWGEDAQFDMLLEELAELAVAVQHYRRGRIGKNLLLDEVADVYIMLDQLQEILKLSVTDIDNAITDKIARLKTILDK